VGNNVARQGTINYIQLYQLEEASALSATTLLMGKQLLFDDRTTVICDRREVAPNGVDL
jgi:hypothetical protein